MEILAYYILFISAVIIIASCVNVEEPNKKLLDNIDNLKDINMLLLKGKQIDLEKLYDIDKY